MTGLETDEKKEKEIWFLRKMKLKNFRGYRDFELNFDDSINVIIGRNDIGRNDIGKSTILEALEIFFNSEKIKMDPSDLCAYAGESTTIEIVCCFDAGSGTILIDSTCTTNCRDEHLLNEDGFLEIKKTWNCPNVSIRKIRSVVDGTYVRHVSH